MQGCELTHGQIISVPVITQDFFLFLSFLSFLLLILTISGQLFSVDFSEIIQIPCEWCQCICMQL